MTGKHEADPPAFDMDAAVARTKDPRAAGQPSGVTMRLKVEHGLPADMPEVLQRWHASVGRGRPAIAVVDAPLPNGAIAQVVRDPASTTPRLVIVSRHSLDDEGLTLAAFLLRQSEMNHPDINERRTITVWRDRHYVVRSGDGMQSGTFDYVYVKPTGERTDAEALLRLASDGPAVHLPDLGRAQLVAAQLEDHRQ